MSSDLTRQTRNQQAANREPSKTDLAVRKVEAQAGELSRALADRVGVERFIRASVTAIRTTPKLGDCSPESILGGLYVAAQLGLEVGGPRGLVYLVPYGTEAALIVGYKGWIDLFYRAGAKAVQWFLVREGDTFRIGSDSSGGKVYRWEQEDPNSTKPVTGAVAQVITGNGGVVWEYLSKADIAKRATNTPFWKRWPDEMALKTVMRRLAATAPLSEDLVLAQSADETVQRRVEAPGIPAEITGRHLPLTATPVEARPTAPPRPGTPSPRPAAPPRTAPPAPARQEAPSGQQEARPTDRPTPEEPGRPYTGPQIRVARGTDPLGDEPEPELQDVEETEAEYEARERAAYEAWLADQEAGR